MNYIESIELDFCTISLREDGIIEQRFVYDKPYEIGAEELIEMSEAMTILSKGNRAAILSIAGLYGSMTPEARKVNIEKDSDYTLAIALVIQELHQRLLANFFFKLKKINYPVKTFKCEVEASEWLQQQIRASQMVG